MIHGPYNIKLEKYPHFLPSFLPSFLTVTFPDNQQISLKVCNDVVSCLLHYIRKSLFVPSRYRNVQSSTYSLSITLVILPDYFENKLLKWLYMSAHPPVKIWTSTGKDPKRQILPKHYVNSMASAARSIFVLSTHDSQKMSIAKSDCQLWNVSMSVYPHGTTRLPLGGF